MKEEISKSQFMDRFADMGRKDNFSYDGLSALYDYLEELEDYELDVIALCCEFCEYENVEQYLKDYKTDVDRNDFDFYDTKDDRAEEFHKAVKEEIRNKTTLIETETDCFIVGCY